MLQSVFPHVGVLIYLNFKASSQLGQSGSTVLADNVKEAFERRFCTTNNGILSKSTCVLNPPDFFVFSLFINLFYTFFA